MEQDRDGSMIAAVTYGFLFEVIIAAIVTLLILAIAPVHANAQALGCYVGLDNPDSCMTKRGIECSTDSKYNERLHGAPVGNLCDVIAIRDKQIEEIAAALRHETRVKRRLLWYIRYLIDRGII